jgi:hypothetical protein
MFILTRGKCTLKLEAKKLFVLGSILAELGGINQAHLSYNHNLVHI